MIVGVNLYNEKKVKETMAEKMINIFVLKNGIFFLINNEHPKETIIAIEKIIAGMAYFGKINTLRIGSEPIQFIKPKPKTFAIIKKVNRPKKAIIPLSLLSKLLKHNSVRKNRVIAAIPTYPI